MAGAGLEEEVRGGGGEKWLGEGGLEEEVKGGGQYQYQYQRRGIYLY